MAQNKGLEMDQQAVETLVDELLEFGVSLAGAERLAPLLLPLLNNPSKLREIYLEMAHRFPGLKTDPAITSQHLH